jgi:hypothetical protein
MKKKIAVIDLETSFEFERSALRSTREGMFAQGVSGLNPTLWQACEDFLEVKLVHQAEIKKEIFILTKRELSIEQRKFRTRVSRDFGECASAAPPCNPQFHAGPPQKWPSSEQHFLHLFDPFLSDELPDIY